MTRKVLTRIQSYELMNFIKDSYVKENISDKKFAELAAEKLGFAVTEGHVYHNRSALSIPAWQPKRSAATLIARIEYLEKVVDKLCADLNIKL